jgi:hypothetical protein
MGLGLVMVVAHTFFGLGCVVTSRASVAVSAAATGPHWSPAVGPAEVSSCDWLTASSTRTVAAMHGSRCGRNAPSSRPPAWRSASTPPTAPPSSHPREAAMLLVAWVARNVVAFLMASLLQASATAWGGRPVRLGYYISRSGYCTRCVCVIITTAAYFAPQHEYTIYATIRVYRILRLLRLYVVYAYGELKVAHNVDGKRRGWRGDRRDGCVIKRPTSYMLFLSPNTWW